jgi:diguanylate cyclase (GGDEF)-like protein/PAS domain S-box-containing protein
MNTTGERELDPARLQRTFLDAQAMARVGVWEWDQATGLVEWSPELCRIYGFDPDDFEHDFDRFLSTVIEEDRHLIDRAMIAATTRGEGFDFELRIRREDGEARIVHAVGRVDLDEAGHPERILGTTQDITERRLTEEARRESEDLLRVAFEDAPIGMALVSLEGRMLRVNRACCAIMGRSAQELLDLTFQEITHPEDVDTDLEHLARLLAGVERSYSTEKRYLTPDGGEVWASLSASLVFDADGNPDYFVSQIQDISEQKRLREHLHRLADHDDLTGLFNRRRFTEDLVAQASRASRYGEPATLLIFDLDDFKRVNDTHGHQAGDDLLRRVGAAISQRVRATDLAARLGGDEFAVLLPYTAAPEGKRVAEDLRRAITEAAGDGLTASVGAATLDARLNDPDGAYVLADRAMYAAKRARSTGRPPADA